MKQWFEIILRYGKKEKGWKKKERKKERKKVRKQEKTKKERWRE